MSLLEQALGDKPGDEDVEGDVLDQVEADEADYELPAVLLVAVLDALAEAASLGAEVGVHAVERPLLHDIGLGRSLIHPQQHVAADRIPSILEHISDISSELNLMAQEANLFAAEPAFRQLLLTLDAKRALTLCSLSREAAGGFVDRAALQRLIAELKAELAAIISAEDALAAYIRKLP